MKRTASSIRVALAHARRQGRPAVAAFYAWAKRAGYGTSNTLSVDVPVALDPREWDRYDDPYGRDFSDALADLRNVGRDIGDGSVSDSTAKRKGVKFYVEYDPGTDEETALYDLEAVLEQKLKEMARNDAGLAVLIYGLNNRGRISLDPEVEGWE